MTHIGKIDKTKCWLECRTNGTQLSSITTLGNWLNILFKKLHIHLLKDLTIAHRYVPKRNIKRVVQYS